MKLIARYALVLVLSALPFAAKACPTGEPDTVRTEKSELYAALASSGSETAGQSLEEQIWKRWTTAPDQKAQLLLNSGLQRIRWADHDEAERILSDLVAYCPGYAEGWNQRAFARFLKNDFAAALEDLDRAIEIEPRHFAALAGRALTLIKMGKDALAQITLREAVRLNPWLAERHLLTTPIGRKI